MSAHGGRPETVEDLRDVLLRGGFVPCDSAVCGCGSWHHRYGYPERMREIQEMLDDAGHPLTNANGNLLRNAVAALIAERDALLAKLEQQPAPVDLEQFREAVSADDVAVLRRLKDALPTVGLNGWHKGVAALDRLLALIDNAGKVASAEQALYPDCWRLDDRELNAARLKALHRGLELSQKWSRGTGAHGHTDRMVRDMADELRRALSSQDGDYAHQPAPVVDDAMVERAQVAWMRAVPLATPGCSTEFDDAMRAALTAALARAQGVQS